MSKADLLILGHILDTKNERGTLVFTTPSKTEEDSDLFMMRVVLNLLNIPANYYRLKRKYDSSLRSRIVIAKLNFDIKLNVELSGQSNFIELKKNEEIIVFRHNHHSEVEALNLISEAGFSILHANISKDENQIMVISKLKNHEKLL